MTPPLPIRNHAFGADSAEGNRSHRKVERVAPQHAENVRCADRALKRRSPHLVLRRPGSISHRFSSWLGQTARGLALLLAGGLPLMVGAQTTVVQVGVAYQADFAVTGAPKAASSYALWGLPPGLTVLGAGQSVDTYALSGPFGTISGTPTTMGTYTINVQAWESSDHTGPSRTHTYTLIVGDAATPLPPEPVTAAVPLPTPVVSNPAPVMGGGGSGGGGGGGAPSGWFCGLIAALWAVRFRRHRCKC